ncbi:beta-casein [Tamandua tetradactyla]|uniref:beta-casein n=1 Tax=Tamandua tetradactyla TaxID=48850 RepID=UPI0040537F0A
MFILSETLSPLVLHLGRKELIAMKVLILACLVALALARETVESFSSSEESSTEVNKKIEKTQHEEQQREDETQDKIHPFIQPQPLIYPYAEPILYPVLQQNVLPLAQPAMMLPFLQSEIMKVPEDKDNIFSKPNVMPFLKSPRVPFTDSQTPSLNDREHLYLPLPLLQPLIHQQPQPIPQGPVVSARPQLSLSQPQILPVPQHMMPQPQKNIPIQAFLLYQEPALDFTPEFYPMTQQLPQGYNPITVSSNRVALLVHS